MFHGFTKKTRCNIIQQLWDLIYRTFIFKILKASALNHFILLLEIGVTNAKKKKHDLVYKAVVVTPSVVILQ